MATTMRTDAVLRSAALALLVLASAPAARAVSCPAGSHPIDQLLPTGARWEMCWEERPQEGVVLREVHYAAPGEPPRRVLEEASVAQIHLVYDDDRARRHIVSEDGLGGASRVDLAPDQCPDGSLLADGGANVLCRRTAGRGYVYKYYTSQRQGFWLELFQLARTGDLAWIVRWRFYDDGAIEPALATTGSLTELGSDPDFGLPVGGTGEVGVGWVASIYWRLDFDIGASGSDDLVERFEVTADGSTKSTSVSVVATELGESLDPARKRSWRVRDTSTTNADGHPVSYHLEPLQAGHRYVAHASEPWAQHDFYVTAHDPCERLASQNDTAAGCGSDLAAYVDGQPVAGADVVLWYRTTHHHLPRDEDLPSIGTRWQGFLLVPRDWTADNPLALLAPEPGSPRPLRLVARGLSRSGGSSRSGGPSP